MIELTKKQSKLLENYYQAKIALRLAKEREAELNAMVAEIFPRSDHASSTTTYPTSTTEKNNADDAIVKIKRDYNYRFDTEVLDAVSSDLTEEERDCINYKPDLSMAKYKKCNHSTLDQALIVTDAKPVIEVIFDEK